MAELLLINDDIAGDGAPMRSKFYEYQEQDPEYRLINKSRASGHSSTGRLGIEEVACQQCGLAELVKY